MLFQGSTAKQGLSGLGTMCLRAVPKSLHLTLPLVSPFRHSKKKKKKWSEQRES